MSMTKGLMDTLLRDPDKQMIPMAEWIESLRYAMGYDAAMHSQGVIPPDMNQSTEAYRMGYSDALGDILGDIE